MTIFNYTLLVNDPLADIISTPLGADSSNKYVENDIGKGVKLNAAAVGYIPLAKDDEIEGVVVALSPETVNDGFSFGSVQKNRRAEAVVGASELGTVAVGELLVADTPIAQGTAGIIRVYPGAPTTHLWRCIAIVTGTGAAGDTILMERV
jgi:hypothetical protein